MALGLFYNYYIHFLQLCLYLLSCSIFLIILQTNPVYAVFSFILSAFCVFILFLLLGAEFFALLILIIYIGVITILFLFVVIMYNLKTINVSQKLVLSNPFFIFFICKILWTCHKNVYGLKIDLTRTLEVTHGFTLDVLLLTELFNSHFFLFLICGLLIFIAMLGSIVITYPFYKSYK